MQGLASARVRLEKSLSPCPYSLAQIFGQRPSNLLHQDDLTAAVIDEESDEKCTRKIIGGQLVGKSSQHIYQMVLIGVRLDVRGGHTPPSAKLICTMRDVGCD